MGNVQRLLTEEFQGLYERRPGSGDLLASDGWVWKFVGTHQGVWHRLGAQNATPGIEFVLAQDVMVCLPPDLLLRMLLLAKTNVNAETAEQLVQVIFSIFAMAGWEHPDASSGEPIPGEVQVYDPKFMAPAVGGFETNYFGGNRTYKTDDLRPVLAYLADPEVKSILVKCTDGTHTWADLNGYAVTVKPQEESDGSSER